MFNQNNHCELKNRWAYINTEEMKNINIEEILLILTVNGIAEW